MTQWFYVTRPWSFTASAIPVLLGGMLAAHAGYWHSGLFLLTLAGGMLLHAAANLWNTWGDFVHGVDTPESSAGTNPWLVLGQLKPEAVRKAAWLALAAALGVGIWLTWLCGAVVPLFGITGVLGGYAYTCGKKPYKYLALGPFMVFLLMGPLMVLPAWLIQGAGLNPAPLLLSLPVACLVTAIMHANDMRDVRHDRAAGIRTVALWLGPEKSRRLYAGLCLAAYLLVVLSVALKQAPLGALLIFALLPAHIRVLRQMDVPALEGISAKFHCLFGALLILGLGLSLAAARLL